MMSNLICGRKPTFGDIEQINVIKEERARLRRLEELEEKGYIVPERAYVDTEISDNCINNSNGKKEYAVKISFLVQEQKHACYNVLACDSDDAEGKAEKIFYDEHPDGDIQSTNCVLTTK